MFGFWLPSRVYENLPPVLFYGAILLKVLALIISSALGANLLALSGFVLMACAWQILVMRTKHREGRFLLRRLFLFVPDLPNQGTTPGQNKALVKAFGIDGLEALDDSRQ